MTEVELVVVRELFDAAVRSAIVKSYELGYAPTRFEQMLADKNPVEVGKRLVVSSELQHGIKELAKLGHLELTIESIMLDSQFASLFSKAELDAAQWRLDHVLSNR